MTQRERLNAMTDEELYEFIVGEELQNLKCNDPLLRNDIVDWVSTSFKDNFLKWLNSEVKCSEKENS